MPFVPAPNICQVEMRATRNGQKVENRVMVNMLAAPVESEMTDLGTAVWNWWADTYALNLTSDTHLDTVVVTDMGEENGSEVTIALASNVQGQINLTGLPNETSFCVSLRSGARGRSGRGRFYTLSVAPDQMANANELTTGAGAAFVGAVQELINVVAALGKELVIVSYISDKEPRPGGPVYFTVRSAIATDLIVDSQRRRKPGNGR